VQTQTTVFILSNKIKLYSAVLIFGSRSMVALHIKLVKPFSPHVIACSVRKDQSICRTKEQKARLQRLARAMPKSVMPSGAKNGKVSKEKKRKNLAVLAETPRMKRFFQ